MRGPDELLRSALAVIDSAFSTPAVYVRKTRRGTTRRHYYAKVMAPLLSGGHDSICACHVASRHPKFGGEVFHINTGIGARATRAHVEFVCRELGWKLTVVKSPETYENQVRHNGFPGPGSHKWVYIRLKERCVAALGKGRRVAFITGARAQESTRRMGYVGPLRIGEEVKRLDGTREVRNLNRYWVSPCHDWSAQEQAAYMDEHDLPKNPLKIALGMSGECFCGAFASPGELNRIRHYAPDVAAEIDRLAVIARQCGKHDKWGERPPKETGIIEVETGPLCTSCDIRAANAGIVFSEIKAKDSA